MRWGSEPKSPERLLIFGVPSSSGAALGHHGAALPGEVLLQRTGMLALTHRHLACGDYKSQHPPLTARPRPLVKAGPGRGGGAVPARGPDKWPLASLASRLRGQPGLRGWRFLSSKMRQEKKKRSKRAVWLRAAPLPAHPAHQPPAGPWQGRRVLSAGSCAGECKK